MSNATFFHPDPSLSIPPAPAHVPADDGRPGSSKPPTADAGNRHWFRRAALAFLLAGSAAPAVAAPTWWFAEGATHTCAPASAQPRPLKFPEEAREWARMQPGYSGTIVYRDNSGAIGAVVVKITPQMGLFYFTAPDTCERYEASVGVNPAELR